MRRFTYASGSQGTLDNKKEEFFGDTSQISVEARTDQDWCSLQDDLQLELTAKCL